MQPKIAVFDTDSGDCGATADAIRAHYQSTGQQVEIKTYIKAYSFVRAFEEGRFAMAFLALNSPLDLDAARKAGAIAPDCPLLFVCNSEDYGLEPHRLMALDYLLKPVSREAVARAVGRIGTAFGRSRRRSGT